MVGAALAVLTGQAASTARSAASIQEGPLLNHDSALRGRQEKCRRLRSFNAGVGPNLCAADDDVFCVQLSLTSASSSESEPTAESGLKLLMSEAHEMSPESPSHESGMPATHRKTTGQATGAHP